MESRLTIDLACVRWQIKGNVQVAQLSQRDRVAVWVSYGQKRKAVNGRQYFTDIIGLSSTTMT